MNKISLFAFTALLTLTTSPVFAARVGSCEAVFNGTVKRLEARLTTEQALEKMSARDVQLARNLVRGGVRMSGLLNRYDQLIRYGRGDTYDSMPTRAARDTSYDELSEGRMLTAPNSSYIRLAASSVKHSLTLEHTIHVMNEIGASTMPKTDFASARPARLWLSSKNLMALTEIAIRKNIEPRVLGAEFVELVSEISKMEIDLTSPLLVPPMDQAIQILEKR